MSEKHVKIYNGVPIAIGKIAIGHGDFIEIREHREISGGLLFICHGNISTIKVTGKRTLQVSMCPGGKKGPENDPIQHKAIQGYYNKIPGKAQICFSFRLHQKLEAKNCAEEAKNM